MRSWVIPAAIIVAIEHATALLILTRNGLQGWMGAAVGTAAPAKRHAAELERRS